MRKLKLDELERPSPEEFASQQKLPIIVILDNIRSGLNVGSVFRSSDAFAISKIYLCGITARPPHREILKTAIGATETVDWEYRESVSDLVNELKKEGVSTWAIEQTSESISLSDWDHEGRSPIAIILGNEVNGVSEEVLPLINGAIEIPQYGTKHSLNVSVCGGIILWEAQKFFRK